MAPVLIRCVRVYQRLLSPVLARLGVRCRFYPSCSSYAILAIEKHGWRRGCALAWNRLTRCRIDNTESCIDYP